MLRYTELWSPEVGVVGVTPQGVTCPSPQLYPRPFTHLCPSPHPVPSTENILLRLQSLWNSYCTQETGLGSAELPSSAGMWAPSEWGVCSVHHCVPRPQAVPGPQCSSNERVNPVANRRMVTVPKSLPRAGALLVEVTTGVGTHSSAGPHLPHRCWSVLGRQEHQGNLITSPWPGGTPMNSPTGLEVASGSLPGAGGAGRGWMLGFVWAEALQSSRDQSPGEVGTEAGRPAGRRVPS